MTHTRSTSMLALAAVVALPALSWAGTTEAKTKAAPAPAAEKINSSAITGDIGVSVYSAMYSRGQILAKHAPTILPYIDLYGTAYEGDGFISKVVFGLNVTEYYSEPATSTGVHNQTWYENDFIPSIAISSGKFTLTESYHWYFNPKDISSNGGTFQGLNSSLSFDDGDLLGAFALHPSVTYMQRTNAHGQYFEGAVAPGTSFGPLAITVPLTIGYGEDGFYAGSKNGFAYFSAGLNTAYTLPMPKSYGVWKVTAGVTYYAKDSKVTEQGSFAGVKDNDVTANAGLVINF